MKLFVKAEGEFRGGDPEELRLKKQEKQQEMMESGDAAEADTGEEGGEPPDPAEIEEAKMEEQEKKEASGKSLGKSAASFPPGYGGGASQVSPIETNSDYVPRDKNNEPVHPLEYRGHAQSWIDVGPPRRGENQWKPWSEVIGAKVPNLGSPNFHLRQFKDPKDRAKEQLLMSKAQSEDNAPMGGARQLLEQIPQMSEDQLRQFAKQIWGDDFEYEEWANEEYMREDLIGSVMDLIESKSAQHVDEMNEAAPSDLRW